MARSLKPEHLKKYLKGGELHRLFEVIREDPELSFEIRRDNVAMVYFNKKRILTISESRNKTKIEPLSANYYNKETGDYSWVDTFKREDWNKKDLIRTYFSKAKKYAYKESRKAEFQLQQSVALGNCSFDGKGRYVVVDMEWAFSQAGLKDKISRTRPDLVIVDTQRNELGKNDIFLAEVKLGIGATEGKSGLQDHVDKTYDIYNCPQACDALIEDTKSIIEQKTELRILKGEKPLFDFSEKPRMMFILGYRGDNELKELKEQVSKIILKGMGDPVCVYIDTREVLV